VGWTLPRPAVKIHNSAQKHFVGTLSISLFQFKLFRKKINFYCSLIFFLSKVDILELLAQQGEDHWLPWQQKRPLLHIACERGAWNCVKYLVSERSDEINQVSIFSVFYTSLSLNLKAKSLSLHLRLALEPFYSMVFQLQIYIFITCLLIVLKIC